MNPLAITYRTLVSAASRRRAVVLSAVVALALGASDARAQRSSQRTRAFSPSSGNYGGFGGITNVGRIGNTAVTRGFGYGGQGPPPPPSAGAGGLSSAGVPQTFRRRMPIGTDLVYQDRLTRMQSRVNTVWQQRIAPAGASRYFRQDYFRGRFGRGGQLGPMSRSYLLFAPQKLLAETSFIGPVYNEGMGLGGPRDALSLRENPLTPDFMPTTPATESRYSQADLMASRLEAKHRQRIKQAWDYFQEGSYQQARAAFASAEMLDRHDPEPRAGLFFCTFAQQQFYQAVHAAGRVFRHRDPDENPFLADYKLEQRYYQPKDPRTGRETNRLDDDLRRLVRFAEGRRQESEAAEGQAYAEDPSARREELAGTAAAVGFAMWHGGDESDRREALRYARMVDKIDPGGALSGIAELMSAAQAAGQTDKED